MNNISARQPLFFGILFASFFFSLQAIAVSDSVESVKNDHEHHDEFGLRVESYSENKKKMLVDISKSVGISKALEGDDLKCFGLDVQSLIDGMSKIPGDDQSLDFWSAAEIFSRKYESSFPVGYITRQMLADVSIKKNSSRIMLVGEGYHKSEQYSSLGLVLLKRAEILGVSRKLADKETSEKMIKMAFLILFESEPNACFGDFRYDFFEEAKKSSCVKWFLKTYPHAFDASKKTIKNSYVFSHEFRKLLKTIDPLAQAQGKRRATKNEINDIVRGLQAVETTVEGDYSTLSFTYCYIRSVWVLKNIAIASNDNSLLVVATEKLKKIETNSSSPVARRWASEAMKCSDSHIPKRMYEGMLMLGVEKNKTWVDEDGDGKPDHLYDPKDYE